MTDSNALSTPSFFLFVDTYLRRYPIPHSKLDLDKIGVLKEIFEERQVFFKELSLIVTGFNPKTHREIDIAKLRCLEDKDGRCLSPFGMVLNHKGQMCGRLRIVATQFGYPQVRKEALDLNGALNKPWSKEQLKWKESLESAWFDHQAE